MPQRGQVPTVSPGTPSLDRPTFVPQEVHTRLRSGTWGSTSRAADGSPTGTSGTSTSPAPRLRAVRVVRIRRVERVGPEPAVVAGEPPVVGIEPVGGDAVVCGVAVVRGEVSGCAVGAVNSGTHRAADVGSGSARGVAAVGSGSGRGVAAVGSGSDPVVIRNPHGRLR